MEGVGILNAWTMNVVPKSARITVITSDSKYSRAVDFLKTASAILDCFLLPRADTLESLLRGGLFGRFLSQTYTAGGRLAINNNVNSKQFLMIRSSLTGHNI